MASSSSACCTAPAKVDDKLPMKDVQLQLEPEPEPAPDLDLQQLKGSYKMAKRRSDSDPSNEELADAYKEEKRRYKQAAAASTQGASNDTDVGSSR